MTPEQAKANQERIAKNYNLGWWYGTHCTKCCGVYPKMMVTGGFSSEDAYYQCEVCGKRTKAYIMPHLAESAWNRGEFADGGENQISLF